MDRTEIHVILNSVSLSRLHKDPEKTIREVLDHHRYDIHFFRTSAKGEAAELAAKAVAGNVPVVVAAGGDGTVNEVGSKLIGTPTLLGIIPIGSGNGLARSLEIPLSVHRSASVIHRMKSKVIDTGKINGRSFFSVAGAGFDARVAYLYQESKRRGFMAYLSIVAKEMLRYRPRRYRLETQGRVFERKAFLITVSNSGQFGYNTVIAPDARVDDGFLDLVIIRSIPFWRVPLLAYRLMTRTIDRQEETETFRMKKVRITRTKGRRVNIDGESIKMGKVLDIGIDPSSLNVIIP